MYVDIISIILKQCEKYFPKIMPCVCSDRVQCIYTSIIWCTAGKTFNNYIILHYGSQHIIVNVLYNEVK